MIAFIILAFVVIVFAIYYVAKNEVKQVVKEWNEIRNK